MAATTPREMVVEIDGLWFKLSKLRGRRSLRGARVIQELLGPSGFNMLLTPEFWGAGKTAKRAAQNAEKFEQAQLAALGQNVSKTNASLEAWEAGVTELLAWTAGEGVQYSDAARGVDEAGWIPIRDTGTLDAFDRVDYKTWLALCWAAVKHGYRPTFAASGTSDGTASAASTSTRASSPAGAPKKLLTGSPTSQTAAASGFSGG